MSENGTLKLRRPVRVLGEEVAEISFREPRGKDLRMLPIMRDGMTMGPLIDFGAQLAVYTLGGQKTNGLPKEAMDEMHPKDVLEVIARIGPFLL